MLLVGSKNKSAQGPLARALVRVGVRQPQYEGLVGNYNAGSANWRRATGYNAKFDALPDFVTRERVRTGRM